MIKKQVGIITSLGRTGTLFFSQMLEDVVSDSETFHEVGYLNFGQYKGWLGKYQEVSSQISKLGFENIVLKKIMGQWGLIRISEKNFLNQLDREKAVKHVIQRRKDFIESTCGNLYLEASSEYYGIIDLFPDIFEKYKVVYIVRDGRDWVRSKMNFGRGAERDPTERIALLLPGLPVLHLSGLLQRGRSIGPSYRKTGFHGSHDVIPFATEYGNLRYV